MPQEALRRLPLEEVGAVLGHGAEPGRGLLQGQSEIELGRGARRREGLQGEAPEVGTGREGVLEGEQPGPGASGWGRAGAAARPPGARRARPGGRRPPGASRTRARSPRKRGRPERSARSTSVLTKKPISPSAPARVRLATGAPTAEVVLPAVARAAGPGRPASRTMNSVAPSRSRQAPAGRATRAGRDEGGDHGAVGGAAPRDGAGRRAAPGGRRPARRCSPVGELPLQHLALQPAAAARRRSRRTAPAAPAGRGPRPGRRRRRGRRARARRTPIDQPSADDVVHGQQQHVLRSAQAQQARPRSSGPAARSNGAPASARAQATTAASRGSLGAGRCRSTTGRRQPAGGGDDLHRAAVRGGEGGAQGLVAAHQRVEGALQGRRRRAARPGARRRGCCRRRCPARAGPGTTAAAGRRRAGRAPVARDGSPAASGGRRGPRRRRGGAGADAARRGRPRWGPRTGPAGAAPPRRRRAPGPPPGSPAGSGRPGRRSRPCTPTRGTPEQLGPDGGDRLLLRRAGGDVAPRRCYRRPRRARAGPCGRPCRWGSGAGPPASRRPPAPCSSGSRSWR